jgi:membrane dipeptidase
MIREVSAALLLVAAPALLAGQGNVQALEQARRFLATHRVVDGHNDLPWEIRVNPASLKDPAKYDLRGTVSGQTDIARLRAGGVGGQFWSVYLPFELEDSDYAKAQLEQIDIAKEVINRYPDVFALALSANDVVRIMREGRIASLLGMEGGHAIENSLKLLRQYYDLGVRYMALTHNGTLEWADAATGIARHNGLTDFGREVVREMNRIGMLVDLSHAAPTTMRDALDVAQAPVIFSHSSALAVLDHPRNVPDDVLRRLPENGGVVMVTFVGPFISKRQQQWTAAMRDSLSSITDREKFRAAQEAYVKRHPRPKATVAELADHVDHIRKVAGIDHVGLGGDYDGTNDLPEGMEDVSGYPLLVAELIRRGWSEEDLIKLVNGNIIRALREAEQVRDRFAAAAP